MMQTLRRSEVFFLVSFWSVKATVCFTVNKKVCVIHFNTKSHVCSFRVQLNTFNKVPSHKNPQNKIWLASFWPTSCTHTQPRYITKNDGPLVAHSPCMGQQHHTNRTTTGSAVKQAPSSSNLVHICLLWGYEQSHGKQGCGRGYNTPDEYRIL